MNGSAHKLRRKTLWLRGSIKLFGEEGEPRGSRGPFVFLRAESVYNGVLTRWEPFMCWVVAALIQPVCPIALLYLAGATPPESPTRALFARLQAEALSAALDRYRADVGAYPAERVGLRALTHNFGAANWRGPYLNREIPHDPIFRDPWGGAYLYRVRSGGRPEVIAAGALPEAVNTRRRRSLLCLTGAALAALGFFGYPFLPNLLEKFNRGSV